MQKSFLNIINVDAGQEALNAFYSNDLTTFAEVILEKGMPFQKVNDLSDFEIIIKNTPVYLVSSDSFKKIESDYTRDILGLYTQRKISGKSVHEIYICLDKVFGETNNDMTHFKYLFTKVLIHEFGHAWFAKLENNRPSQVNSSTYRLSSFDDTTYRLLEESSANYFALEFIQKNDDKKFLEYAKSYIEHQSEDYKFANTFFNLEIKTWSVWKNLKFGHIPEKSYSYSDDLRIIIKTFFEQYLNKISEEKYISNMLKNIIEELYSLLPTNDKLGYKQSKVWFEASTFLIYNTSFAIIQLCDCKVFKDIQYRYETFLPENKEDRERIEKYWNSVIEFQKVDNMMSTGLDDELDDDWQNQEGSLW